MKKIIFLQLSGESTLEEGVGQEGGDLVWRAGPRRVTESDRSEAEEEEEG